MKKHIPVIILGIYIAILMRVMVFKDIPTIRIGHLMLNFSGTESGYPANFIPFKTIVSYLLGNKGLIIVVINLIGNIALLIPIGILVPLIWKNISWKQVLLIGIASGLAVELLQAVFHVGIFDIDDVILNALGVLLGYGMLVLLVSQ